MWQADPHELLELRKIFKASLSASHAERSAALEFLSHAKNQPQFDNYLCHILVHDTLATPDVRGAAGIHLKNAVGKEESAPRDYLRLNIMLGLVLLEAMVRNIAGNVISSMFAKMGVLEWPEALAQLMQIPESPDTLLLLKEAAVVTLAKICEDSAYALDQPYNGERPLDFLAGRLMSLAGASNSTPKMKTAVVHALNHLVPLKSPLVLVLLDNYLQTLFGIAGDNDAAVRKTVCTAFLSILETRPDRLMPHMDGVVAYCIHLLQDSDDGVAMEACEFLLALSERPEDAFKPLFRVHLATVLPVLLQKMVYSEAQIALIDLLDERDGTKNADRQEDVRPQMARSKEMHRANHKQRRPKAGGRENGSGGTAYSNNGPAYVEVPSDSDDRAAVTDTTFYEDSEADSGSDSDQDIDDELDLWNIRRCAAATLDAVSLNYPQIVVDVTLPILQKRIVSTEWRVREAAILAFGAISASCTEHASDKLPTLVPFLVDRMRDPETRVRQISCWTLSRYASWVCEEAHAGSGGQYASYFQHTFEAVVLLTLDRKKLVQQVACSALSQFVEAADVSLIVYYVGPLLDHFAQCFSMYQRKNLLMLYDCVSTFVERIGPAVFGLAPEHAATLLPPLLRNWQLLDDTDQDLWPLMECMSVVAATMGEEFAPYAMPVYERALKILAQAIQLNQDMHTNPLIEAPEKDFTVAALDLIDGLVQGFKEHSVDMMKRHGASAMPLVLACLDDHDDDVRQLTYALLGDLAIFACKDIVEPCVDHIVLFAGNEMDRYSYSTYPVTNNAVWAFGEIAIRANAALLQPHMYNITHLLIRLLCSTETQQTVLENAAVCLGRLGIAGGAPVIVPSLPEFIYSWCTQMMYVLENEEKESAFLGMVQMLNTSPDAGVGGLSNQQGRKNLAVVVSCIGNYFEPLEKLKEVFFQTLASYKEMAGPAWETEILSLVDTETRGFLKNSYGV